MSDSSDDDGSGSGSGEDASNLYQAIIMELTELLHDNLQEICKSKDKKLLSKEILKQTNECFDQHEELTPENLKGTLFQTLELINQTKQQINQVKIIKAQEEVMEQLEECQNEQRKIQIISDEAKSNLLSSEEEIQELEKQLENFGADQQAEIDEYKKEINQKNIQNNELNQKLENLQNDMEMQKQKAAVEKESSGQTQLMDSLNQFKAINKDLRLENEDLNAKMLRVEKLNQTLTLNKAKQTFLLLTVTNKDKQLSKLQNELDEQKQEMDKTYQKVIALNEEKKQLKSLSGINKEEKNQFMQENIDLKEQIFQLNEKISEQNIKETVNNEFKYQDESGKKEVEFEKQQIQNLIKSLPERIKSVDDIKVYMEQLQNQFDNTLKEIKILTKSRNNILKLEQENRMKVDKMKKTQYKFMEFIKAKKHKLDQKKEALLQFQSSVNIENLNMDLQNSIKVLKQEEIL